MFLAGERADLGRPVTPTFRYRNYHIILMVRLFGNSLFLRTRVACGRIEDAPGMASPSFAEFGRASEIFISERRRRSRWAYAADDYTDTRPFLGRRPSRV